MNAAFGHPLYLHFLDRELGQSVSFKPSAASCQLWIRTLLLSTTSSLICSTSLLWESPLIDESNSLLLGLLLAAGLLDSVSSHPTVDEFRESRAALYAHD